MESYNAKEMKKLEKQMKAFGKSLGVFHEIVSDDLHIDCELFKTKINKEEFYTIVTIGMSLYTMNGAAHGYENTELMMCMPLTWNYNEEKWPFTLLKTIAMVPYKEKGVLGPFHTLDMQSPLYEESKFSKIFIEFPRNFMPKDTILKLNNKQIRVLQVYPIYDDELEEIFKENEDVMNKIVENTVFDENRKSTVNN